MTEAGTRLRQGYGGQLKVGPARPRHSVRKPGLRCHRRSPGISDGDSHEGIRLRQKGYGGTG
jgi:hypothetical protein